MKLEVFGPRVGLFSVPVISPIIPNVSRFMNPFDYLGKILKVKIDRPLGSAHPKHGYIYPVNYGFIPDTVAPDGEEVDVYVLGESTPISQTSGKCIAYIQRHDDVEDKLVISTDNRDYSKEEIYGFIDFQEQFFDVTILMAK